MFPTAPAGARLAAVTAIVLSLATLAAQDVLPPSSRTFAGLAAAGIDRGINTDDARPARSAGALAAADDAAPYLGGSIIVKFRLGTSPAAQQAMLASIGGSGTPDASYA